MRPATTPKKRRSTASKRGAYRSVSKTRQRNWLQPLRMVGVTLVWVLALGAGLAASIYGYQKLDAPVAEIAVTSELEHVTREQVEQWVSEQLDGGFFSLDMNALCAELESHPWVARVSARRQWPDRLLLHITEEVPVARWGETQFINQRGEVLPAITAADFDSENLPKLVGPEGKQLAVMTAYAGFAKRLNAANAGLRQLTLNARGDWQLQLSEGEKLVLGRDQLEARLNRFLVLWQQELLPRRNQVVSVDARYEKGLAVQWRPVDIESGNQEGNSPQHINQNNQVGSAG